MKRVRVAAETIVLLFLVFTILWRGGKALDATWLLALLSVGIIVWSRRSVSRSVPVGFLLLLLGLVFWTILSFVYSTTKNYGFDEILQTVSLALLTLWAATECLENPKFPERFAQSLSLGTLLACVIGIGVYIVQPVSRFVGTFFDYRFHTDYWPNAWAEFLLLVLPLLVWVLWTRRDKDLPLRLRHDWVKAAVLGFVIGCLLLSFSRGGLIAFAGETLLFGALAVVFYRKTIEWKRVPLAAAVSVLVAVGLFVGVNSVRSYFYDVQSVAAKATFSSAEGASSVSERQDFWQQATSLARWKPIVGWGPYSFRFVQPHWQLSILATSDHPHNVFLKYAAERGVPAMVMLLAILLWAVLAGIRSMKTSSVKILPLNLFFVVGVAGTIAHNLIDYNLQFVAISLPLWMMIGMLVARPSKGTLFLNLRRFEVIVACALLLFVLFEGANLVLSSRARHAAARGDVFSALSWYSLTDTSLFPRDAWLSRAALYMGLHQLPQAEDAVSRYLGTNAEDGRAWRLLGDIYLQWNKRQDALRAYEKAYQFAKYNDIGIARGLISMLEEQDHEELLERRHEFDSLLNDFGLAIQQNTHFIALSPNVENLVGLCNDLAKIFPNEAPLYKELADRASEHAAEERAKTSSRPRGLLW